MVAIPLAFILSLVSALALTPVARAVARRLGVLDAAGVSFRKIHASPIPRLGGVAIVAAFYLPLLGLLVTNSGVGWLFTREPEKAMGLLVGGIPILILGLYDDTVGARAIQKLVVQLAVAVTLFALGFRIELVSTPFGVVDLGVVGPLVTILWIVGLINALNLIDGLDGLASGVALFAAASTFAVAMINDNVLMMLFMAALGGSILGFLVYNFNPATIFMGDTGSMFLGYVVAVTSVQTNTKGAATVALLTPVLALGLPIMDTLLAMSRRALRGQSMFQADKEHIHHRLLALGLSQKKAVFVLYGTSIAFAATGIFIAYTKAPGSAAALGVMAIITVLGIRQLGYLQPGKMGDLAARRRKNLDLRKATRQARRDLRKAHTLEEVWGALVGLADSLGLDRIHLLAPAREPLLWTRGEDGGTVPLDMTLDAHGHRLTLAWLDGRTELTTGEQIALEVVSDEVAEAIGRCLGGAEVVPFPRKDTPHS